MRLTLISCLPLRGIIEILLLKLNSAKNIWHCAVSFLWWALTVSEQLYFLGPEGFYDQKDVIFTVSMCRLYMN